jgi:hypothetical protein
MINSTAAVLECHGLLLRLAGDLRDDVLTRCRDWLAEDRLADVVYAVTDLALASEVSLDAHDLAVLGRLLTVAGADRGLLVGVRPRPGQPVPPFRFVARLPDRYTSVDRSAARRFARTVVEMVSALNTVRSVWQTWRLPDDARLATDPRQVFVVEADAGADLPALTGVLQEVLVAAGLWHPQVEVYRAGTEPSPYQRLARLGSELLWWRGRSMGSRTYETCPPAAPKSA